MEIDMTFEQVNGIYIELRDKYESKLRACGVKCESEIYFENETLDKVENLDDACYFSLDVNVFTESIDKDNGLCFCASVPIKNARVEDDDILDEQKAFEESIVAFADKLAASNDADEVINAESEAIDRKLEEMMSDLEHKIKRNSLISLIAVGVCAVAAIVAIAFNIFL